MVHEEPSKADLPSPGALLRAGREKAGLSAEQVADKLHLLKSIVTQLEEDCYDRIRGDTFVRGYMRNYARLLGIDADEVVGRFNTRSGGAHKAESRFTRRREPLHGSSGASRVGMVAALLAMSAGLLFWNRAPQAEAADTGSGAITVETARGEHVVELGSVDSAAR